MLTAEEARRMMPKSIETEVAELLEAIGKAIAVRAQEGQTQLRYGNQFLGPGAVKVAFGYGDDERTRAIIQGVGQGLEGAGYTLSRVYEERQFVDMDLTVSWK